MLTGKARKGGNMDGVRYKLGDVIITVEQIEGFGKNPGLWIGTENPNQIVKVASFGSEDKAITFLKWLDYMLGLNKDIEQVKWE